MRATYGTLNQDAGTEQEVITIALPDSLAAYEIIKLVPKNRMYVRGLEKNHRKLVTMELVARTIVDTINYHIEIEALDSTSWDRLLACFEPYIDVSRSWEEIVKYKAGGVLL